MSRKTNTAAVTIGIDPGKNTLHLIGLDARGAIVLREKVAREVLLLALGRSNLAEAVALLEQVVARNPEYAPAWAVLAGAYSVTPIFLGDGNSTERLSYRDPTEFRHVVDELLTKAEAAAQRAIQLDPNGAEGYGTSGWLRQARGNFVATEELYLRALALDPNNPNTLQVESLLLAEVGRLKEANAIKQQQRALEPFVPLYNRTTATFLWVDGQNDAAIAILKAIPSDTTLNGLGPLAMIYASLGRYGEAADLLENLSDPFAKNAARLLRTAPVNAAVPQSLPPLGLHGWVYLHVGAPERALEMYEHDVQNGYSGAILVPYVWHPSFAPVRKTERFKVFARNAGMVDYWRAKGWPDLCHPTTGDDFTCD